MQHENQGIYTYQTDEIDLRKLVKSLIERKWFIFGFTGFVALLAIVYVLSLPPSPFIVKTTFLKPDKSSVLHLNKMNYLNETMESLHSSFLANLNKKTFQRKVFIEGDYLTKLNKKNKPIDDVDGYMNGFLASISIELGETSISGAGSSFEAPCSVSIQVAGTKTSVAAEFLDDLIAQTNNKTVSEYIHLINQMIAARLAEISLDRKLSILHKKNARLSKIDELTNSATIARSLGVIKNNFGQDSINSSSTAITVGDRRTHPDWYLYGETALLKRVEILKNVNDEEEFPEIDRLDSEKIRLKSFNIEQDGINAMQLNQTAFASQISYNNKLILVQAIFGGFMLSIFLVLMMNLFKEDEA